MAAHCVWLSEVDIEVLVDRRVGVAHNPVANAILGSGVCPRERALAPGSPWGSALSGPASNDGQNAIETLKTAALLRKVHHLDPRVIDAPAALGRRPSKRGAYPRQADAIGSIEAGKQADLVLLSAERRYRRQRFHDPLQTLVYCLSGERSACGSPGGTWSRAARFPASTWRLLRSRATAGGRSNGEVGPCPPAWQVRGKPGRQRHHWSLRRASAVRWTRPAPRTGIGPSRLR